MHDPDTPYLRPAFTQRLAGLLLAGECIDLTSPHGQGRRRTLRDLRHRLPDSLRILQSNLRDHPQSLASLLHELCSQASCSPAEELGQLLDELEQRPGKSLLILHNFDELHSGRNSGYDNRFFSHLNAASRSANISVLCVSEQSGHNRPLQLQEMQLPPLTGKQIADELRRRGMAETALQKVAQQLLRQQAPYTALDTLIADKSP